MLRRSVVLMLLVVAGSLSVVTPSAQPAQSAQSGVSSEVMDFWVAAGRFYRSVADAAAGREAKPLADLSGTYKVEGSIGAKDYSATLDVSRWKTFKAPPGGTFNVYRTTYDWGDSKVKGIGVLLGNRFYIAYGSENLALFVAAPFVLSDDERPVFARYRDLKRRAAAENAKSRNGNTFSTVKGEPWFSNVYTGEASQTYPAPAYYALWIGPGGGYRHYFFSPKPGFFATPMPKFAEGQYHLSGDFLKENGEAGSLKTDDLEVTPLGENLKIVQKGNARERSKDVSGTAMPLADGTFVILLGGNDDCGVGYYDVKDGKLTGLYTTQDGTNRGTETLTPSASVLSKNAKFFASARP